MDKKYWDNYYKKHGKDESFNKPSTFAKFCLYKYFNKKELKIIELGSGNGRDAVYFARHKLNVVAIDQSTSGVDIEKNNLIDEDNKYLHLQANDFVSEDYSKYGSIYAFYSRFTLHSITKIDEDVLLPNIYNNLNLGGLFCIEVRTTRDPLFGEGKLSEENTFINNNHKRRFIDTDKFRKQVADLGFKELYFIEKNNLSIYKNDNPVLMRLILEK